MVFKEKKGNKLLDAKKLCEDLQLDISNINKIFDVKKFLTVKNEKSIVLSDKEVILNNNKYLIYKLYSYYLKYIKEEYNLYQNLYVKYVNSAIDYNIPKYVEFLKKELSILFGSYILYAEYDLDKTINFMKEMYSYLTESIKKINDIENKAVKKIHNAVETLHNDYNTANNKAIGSEMGWLYGTSTYAGAAAGTFLTNATLEVDQDKAQRKFNSALLDANYHRDLDYSTLLRNTYNNILSNFMKFIFSDDFTLDELNDIDNYILSDNYKLLSKDKLLEIFYKYPFLSKSYYSIISVIDEKNYDKLIEIIDYFENKDSFKIDLQTNIESECVNKLISNSINKEDIITNKYCFYSRLINKEPEKNVEDFMKTVLKNIIVDKSLYFSKETNLEFACEIMIILNNAKTILSDRDYDNLVVLLKKTKQDDKAPKIYGIEDFNSIIGGLAGLVLFFVLVAKIIVIGETITLGLVFKNLIISLVFGTLLSLVNYYTDRLLLTIFKDSYTNPTIIPWFTKKGAKKRKKIILIVLCIIFVLPAMLIIPLSKNDISNRLDIFSAKSWKSDNYSLSFEKTGTLTVKKNGNVKNYYCDINFNDEYDNDKAWYDIHGNMDCIIDGEQVSFTLRTCIYKKYKEDTHLYIECTGKSSVCPPWARKNWNDRLTYDRSNYSN